MIVNVVIVAPIFLLTVLLFGYLHFDVLAHPIRSILISTACMLIAWILTVSVKVFIGTTRRSQLTVPHFVGWIVVHLFASFCFVLASFAVEFLRDQFRLQEQSVFSTAGATAVLFGLLGTIRSYVPARWAKSQPIIVLAIATTTFLILFLCYVLAVNWLVYGNSAELGYWINRIPEKLHSATATFLITISIVCFILMMRFRRQKGFLIDCIGFAIPSFAALIVLLIYWSGNGRSIRDQVRELLFSVGSLSRPLGVYCAINTEKSSLRDSTKTLIDRLKDQRRQLRNRQEIVEDSELSLQSLDRYSSVINYGLARSYVDNAVELCSVDDAEKFEIRQAIARLSREALLKRAISQSQGHVGSFSDFQRWKLVRPVLIGLAKERVELKYENVKAEELKRHTSDLLATLSNARVSSLYQREFEDLFVTNSSRVPPPFSQTSTFPGSLPLFFDGLTEKDLSDTKTLIKTQSTKDIRPESISTKTSADLLKLSQPFKPVDIRPDPKRRTLDYPLLLTMNASNADNKAWTSSIDLSSWLQSEITPLKTTTQKETEGDLARKLILHRAIWKADSLEYVGQIQTPRINYSDSIDRRIADYQAKGQERFSPEELVYVAVAPFAAMTDDPEVNQRLDYVASTIAFSEYADFEKLRNLRIELFKQTILFKGQFVLLLIIVLGLVGVAIDINWTSANGYYRRKLSNSFLTSPDFNSLDRKVSDLAQPSTLPYLLINCVANLQGSDNLVLRERHADPFLISPLFTGSNLLGYVQTKSLERADRRFRLSSAMAISAAAIAAFRSNGSSCITEKSLRPPRISNRQATLIVNPGTAGGKGQFNPIWLHQR